MTITATLHQVRVTPLDDDGQPSGPSQVLPVRSITMTTAPGGTTTMTTELDPSDPTTLTDEEAAFLATRPTKAMVADLLQMLRDERAMADRREAQWSASQRELGAEQAARKIAEGIDTEARLMADLQAAVEGYHQRLREAEEAANRQRGGTYGGGYAMVSDHVRREPYRPALDSPLGRALLHLAARHGVAIEATTVFPEPAGPSLAVIPPHLAGPVQQLVERGW